MGVIKKLLTYLYLNVLGINFYRSDNIVNVESFSNVVVKTIYEYNITFYFCQFDVDYMRHRCFFYYITPYTLYKVYVRFDSKAPDSLKNLPNTVSLFIPTWINQYLCGNLRTDCMVNRYAELTSKKLKK